MLLSVNLKLKSKKQCVLDYFENVIRCLLLFCYRRKKCPKRNLRHCRNVSQRICQPSAFIIYETLFCSRIEIGILKHPGYQCLISQNQKLHYHQSKSSAIKSRQLTGHHCNTKYDYSVPVALLNVLEWLAYTSCAFKFTFSNIICYNRNDR